jgi:hypothetical protein
LEGEEMKAYKTNMGLFIMLPVFVLTLLLTYIALVYNRSYSYMNIINIGIDGIILIYYFVNFSYEIRMDKEGIVYHLALKKYRIEISDLGFVMHSSFLTKFVCKKRNFYILSTPKGSLILKEMFKDFKKDNK